MTIASAGATFAAGNAAQPTICTRSCWGARAPRSTPTQMSALNRAIIHHTAGASDYNTNTQSEAAAVVRAIQNAHMDGNGWADLGYHFIVDRNGFRFEGRSGSMTSFPRGAHDSVNSNSFGFNILGYFHTPHNQQPTLASRNALYDVIAWRMPNPFTGFGSGSYNSRTVGFLDGHRAVMATACPGDLLYQYIGTNYNGGEARLAVNSRIVGTPAIEVIVDNTSAGFTASSNWWTSTSVSGYLGSNYHTRGTAAVSDPARWTVNLPEDGTYEVFARWTSGTNRAASAPYQVVHVVSGALTTTTVNRNQQLNGGSWQSLGTFNFWKGNSERVRLSCWTTEGFYVVADAVRFVKK